MSPKIWRRTGTWNVEGGPHHTPTLCLKELLWGKAGIDPIFSEATAILAWARLGWGVHTEWED